MLGPSSTAAATATAASGRPQFPVGRRRHATDAERPQRDGPSLSHRYGEQGGVTLPSDISYISPTLLTCYGRKKRVADMLAA